MALKPIVVTSPFQNPKTKGKSFEEIMELSIIELSLMNNELVKENESSFITQIKKDFEYFLFSLR